MDWQDIIYIFMAVVAWFALLYTAKDKWSFIKGGLASAVVFAIVILFLSGL